MFTEDILLKSPINSFEVEIDDEVHIFVDFSSMARYSKLFLNMVHDEQKHEQPNPPPKLMGSFDHWKIVHSACVKRHWETKIIFDIERGTRGKFFKLLEFLMLPTWIIEYHLRDHKDFTPEEIQDAPNNMYEQSQVRRKLRMEFEEVQSRSATGQGHIIKFFISNEQYDNFPNDIIMQELNYKCQIKRIRMNDNK